MDDLISRQAVLNATSTTLKITGKENAETVYEYIKKLCDDIKALPSAQRKGRWKKTYLDHEAMGGRPSIFYCSCCTQCIAFPTNFCPSCGADMREER